MRTLAVRKWVSVRVSMLACCCDSGEREHVLTVCDVWVCVCVYVRTLYWHSCLFVYFVCVFNSYVHCMNMPQIYFALNFPISLPHFFECISFCVSECVRRIRTFSTNQVYLHRVYAAIAMQSFVSIWMSSAFGMCLSVGYVLVYARSIAF